jgi:hypothetical protein
MSSEDIIKWPCGTWCYRYELHEFTHKSDDCIVHEFDSCNWHTFFEDIANWGPV